MTQKPSRRELLISGAAIASMPVITGSLVAQPAVAQTASPDVANSTAQIDAYMGAPVELATAPNGAITNKRLLDRIGKVFRSLLD